MINSACHVDLENLISIQGLVKKLQLQTKKHNRFVIGNNLTRAIGRGMEYAESRVYQPGDDVRHIDWRITARHGKAYTKLYHEEKGDNIEIVLDLSSSMYFGTKHALKSVIASKVAAYITWASFAHNHNVGGIFFNNEDIKAIVASNFKNTIMLLLNEITKLHDPNLVNTKNQHSLCTCLQKFEQVIKRNSNIYIISDFLNINDLFIKKINKLMYYNMVTLIRISDPIEEISPPNGNYHISNGHSSRNITINNSNNDLFKKFFSGQLTKYHELISKYKINNIKIVTEPNWYQKLKYSLRQ